MVSLRLRKIEIQIIMALPKIFHHFYIIYSYIGRQYKRQSLFLCIIFVWCLLHGVCVTGHRFVGYVLIVRWWSSKLGQ